MDLFTGKEPHDISLEIASAWMNNYRDENPNSINGHHFGKDIILEILAQNGAVGNRIYYALDDAGIKQLIIVGTEASQNDLYNGKLAPDISLETAAAWTKNYRNKNPNSVNGHYFGKDAILEILAQNGAVGIRIYYALDEAGVKQLIIVGVDASGNDLINGKLAERSINCPPTCGIENPLNSDL